MIPGENSQICPRCGVLTNNLRRHKERNRCSMQHIREDIRQNMKKLEQQK